MSGSLKRLKVARKKGMKMGTFYVHNVRRGKFLCRVIRFYCCDGKIRGINFNGGSIKNAG